MFFMPVTSINHNVLTAATATASTHIRMAVGLELVDYLTPVPKTHTQCQYILGYLIVEMLDCNSLTLLTNSIAHG